MSFRKARDQLVDCIRTGAFGHWPREDLFLKNWLATGRITEDEVRRLLLRCNGTQYRRGDQISPGGNEVHEFFPRDGEVKWYIKAYLNEQNDEAVIEAVFMSVHPSGV